MLVPGAYEIVVTYRDTNYLWHDRGIAQSDITDIAISPTERALHCFVPTFWDHFSQASRIERVIVTLQGYTFRLPWPAERRLDTPPALSLDILLQYDSHTLPTAATWT